MADDGKKDKPNLTRRDGFDPYVKEVRKFSSRYFRDCIKEIGNKGLPILTLRAQMSTEEGYLHVQDGPLFHIVEDLKKLYLTIGGKIISALGLKTRDTVIDKLQDI